jgi:hypothetical protein
VTAVAATRERRPAALAAWIRRHWALVAFCGLVGAFYLWTVWSTGSPVDFGENRTDYYNLLSDGFLGGHLHLATPPSHELLALPNPYDPVANGPFKLHDLSLYKGHYYLYWGPTPALLAFIPFRLLPLGDLPETLAVFTFAFVGFCFSIASLRALAARFAPDAPRWMLAAAMLALATGNALPFTLRRAAVYEVAITAGFCLAFIALYLVITGLRDGVRLKRLAAASLLIGLAVGARPTMLVGAIAMVVLAAWLYRRTPDRHARLAILRAVLGPVVVVGILLAAYNALRFGSPLEFGQKYQLAGYNPADKHGNKLAYIPPGLWYFLLARPHLTLGFPFFHLPPPPLSYPFTPPAEYDGVESVGGLLFGAPFVVLALAGPILLRGVGRQAMLSLIAVGAVIILMVSFALWGATMRYEVDFASILLIAAAIGWMVWAGTLQGPRRRLVAGAGALLIAWGAAFGVAIGLTGYYDGLRSFDPGTFSALQRLTSPLPTAIAYLDGQPKATDVQARTGIELDTDAGPGVGTLTFPLSADRVTLTVVSGSPRRYGLAVAGTPVTPPPPRAGVLIRTPDTNRRIGMPAAFAPAVLPIALRRGLNRIEFSVTGPQGAATRLEGVRLVPLPGR